MNDLDADGPPPDGPVKRWVSDADVLEIPHSASNVSPSGGNKS